VCLISLSLPFSYFLSPFFPHGETMYKRNLCLGFLAFIGSSAVAFGQWTATSYGMPTNYRAKAISLVDQSSNGWQDMVIGAVGPNDRIYRRTGPGLGLTLLQSYPSGGLTDLVVGRFDNLGQPDIATSHSSSNVVRVRRFPAGLQTLGLPSSFSPQKVISIDLDNDKDLDLVTVGWGNIRPHFAKNNGSGLFSGMITVTNLSVSPSRPQCVVAGDFNHDGKTDLVVPRSDGNVSYFRNITVGTSVNFAIAQTYPNANTRPWDVCAGDFNGDGWLDFATANSIGSCSVFINQGPTGVLWTTVNFAKTTYSLGTPNTLPRSICCGDYDCDGDTDLFLGLQGTSKIATLRNNGAGAFTLNPVTATGQFPVDIACGDLDRNGHLDLATAGLGTTTGSVTKHIHGSSLPLKPHIYVGGIQDNFSTSTPTGTEHACPRPGAFTAFVSPRRHFDQASVFRKFGHTFPNVGAGHQFLPRVVKGRLLLRLRGDSISAANDTIGLGWHTSPGRMVFRKRIADMPGVTSYGSGSSIFLSLDLANLPGGINLIPKMNQNKSLDIYTENSTRVDSAFLQIWTCSRVRCLFSLKQTPLIGGTNWTIAAGGAAPGSWIFFFMGTQVAPGPTGPWGQMCLPFPLFYLGAQAAPFGGASLTFTLPTGLPVPCKTISTQALSWTPSSGKWCLSNTWTAQLFN
jgi:hypothetical protein